MALFSKFGNILKESVSKQITSQFSAANSSIYQAIRCMSSSKVFVGGLSYEVDETTLRETFSSYGEVIEARVIVDRESNRSRGFGFVTYTSSEEASSAIQALDGQDIHGRRVRVNYATERAPRMGSYGGGGYGGGGGGGYGGGGYDRGQNYSGGGGYGGGQNYGGSGGYAGGQNYGDNSGGYGGGQNYGGNNGGYSPSVQNTASGGGFAGGNYGIAGGVDGSDSYLSGGAAGNNVTAETGIHSSGLEDGSADQFGSNTSGGLGDGIGDFESKGPLEENFNDDDEPNDDFAKRA